MINGKNVFDKPIKKIWKYMITFKKITTGQGDGCTNGCLLDYNYFKRYYKMIAVDLRKQKALDVDPKPGQQINFTGNVRRANSRVIIFITEEAKETVLDFTKGIVRVLLISPYD